MLDTRRRRLVLIAVLVLAVALAWALLGDGECDDLSSCFSDTGTSTRP